MSITIKQPKTKVKVFLGQALDFVGTAPPGAERIELTADDQFELPTVTIADGKWFVSSRFNQVGTRRVLARAFDVAGAEIGRTEVEFVVAAPESATTGAAPKLTALVPIPNDINKGVTRAKQDTMREIFGRPCELKADCTAVTNPKVKALLVTQDVGPFKVTGIRPAVQALTRIFNAIRVSQPEVFEVLGTAGMLCCRRVRTKPGKPPSKNFSNHAWGTAIDLKISGALDPVGDGKTQFGILLIAPHFNAERFFWGAGFSGALEDAMHFEASDELVREWHKKGLLG